MSSADEDAAIASLENKAPLSDPSGSVDRAETPASGAAEDAAKVRSAVSQASLPSTGQTLGDIDEEFSNNADSDDDRDEEDYASDGDNAARADVPALTLPVNGSPMQQETKFQIKVVPSSPRTAHRNDALSVMQELHEKALQAAEKINSAAHAVVFTGNDISLAGGVADYDSSTGIWSMRASGHHLEVGKRIEDATPTFSHLAIADLIREGLVRHIITLNVDG